MKKIIVFLSIVLLVSLTFWLLFTGATQSQGEGDHILLSDTFVTEPETNQASISKKLYDEGYLHNALTYGIFSVITHFSHTIQAGAYKLSKNMNVFQLYQSLANPYMQYVKISEGERKEEIADRLGNTLDWSPSERKTFLHLDQLANKDYPDGFYLPGTYLVPIDENPAKVGKQIIQAFEEKVEIPFESRPKNVVSLETVLTIASLIQREAAGKNDMALISGIIWNRLFAGWPLQIDATLQYAKGTSDKWWPTVESSDKNIQSEFNTYIYKGLPPSPIANPGISAINAALHPKKTSCFYYIHDKSGGFHCSETYAGQEANVRRFYGGIAKKSS